MREKVRQMLKNEKGMTLVELLAVIVILGIIAAIAIPSIGGIINKTKDDADKSNALMIINAAKIAVASQDPIIMNLVNEDGSSTKKVHLQDLSNAGYLDDIPNDPHDKGKKYWTNSYVVIKQTSDAKYTYSIKLVANDATTTRLEKSEADLN